MKNILPAFLSCQGTSLSDEEKRLFERYNPLGVCLFSYRCENIKDKQQLKRLTQEICETIGREDVLFAVDQEGGRVRRMTEPEFIPLAPQARLTNKELAYQHAFLTAYDLKSCGVNVNFAPVLDMFYDSTSDVLRGRCFSGNAQKVAHLGKVVIDTYIENGICPCIKHIPGHGRAMSDPHLSLPVVELKESELADDFYPFIYNNSAPMGMLAHILLPAIDKKNPATLSSEVIHKIVRGVIGFDGFLVSDALVMRALSGTMEERAKAAIAAGCDAVCVGNADFATNEAICRSGIVLSDEGVYRLKKVYDIVHKTGKFINYEYIKNKYCTKLKNILSYEYQYDATEVLNKIKE